MEKYVKPQIFICGVSQRERVSGTFEDFALTHNEWGAFASITSYRFTSGEQE